MNNRRIATIALLSCLSFVGRLTFTFLPNVQPTTVIILIVTLYFGVVDGVLVAVISMLMSNLYLGMGIWTIAQIVSYSIIVIVFHLLSLNIKSDIYLSILAFISGLMYGFFISLVQAPFISWYAFIPYYISGLPYDIAHAVGNLIFFIMLHPALKPILIRHIEKGQTY